MGKDEIRDPTVKDAGRKPPMSWERGGKKVKGSSYTGTDEANGG